MKLASLKNGSRDGELIIVSRDIKQYVSALDIVPTLQAALDDWRNIEPVLAARAQSFARGEHRGTALDTALLESPLPRAYQWLDGSAYVNHVELVRRARGAEIPQNFWTDPLMYQGGSDSFLGPRDELQLASETWGIDFEAELAVITDDVPMGASEAQAGAAIRLLMLVNDVSLRGLIPDELAKGFGFLQSKPASAFSPVAVTVDELGAHWNNYKLCLPLRVDFNGLPFGRAHAGRDMTFNFAKLVAHAAKTRPLAAGSIVGSGTVSNKQEHASAIADGGVGYSCIAELRMIETITNGSPMTSFMNYGDTVKIEMYNDLNESIFGAIDQSVVQYSGAS